MIKIAINTDTINLNQFLKWSNIVTSGGEAKLMIKEGNVIVNDEIETKRSKTLSEGDIVEVAAKKYKIVTK